MRKTAALTALIALATAMVGCSSSDGPVVDDGKAATGKKELTVAISNLGLSFPFPAAIGAGIKDEAAKLGVKVTELDAQGKADKQGNDIQDIIGQRPDGVLMLPVDSGVASGLVDKLGAANIPVVAVASQVGDPAKRKLTDVYPGLVALVTQDEPAAGKQAGEIATQVLPKGGPMAVVEGAAGFAEVQLRFEQFMDVPKEKNITFEVVARQPGDWVQDKARSACQNMLAAHTGVKLFYAQSDDMSVGCAKAVKSARSEAKVIGIGGSKLGIEAVRDGSVAGTVCFKPEDLGRLAMRTLYEHLTGAKPHKAEFVSYETPAITKANLDQCTPQW